MNKLLLVDDSASLRRIMVRVLREADLDLDDIVEADSLVAAVEVVRRDPDVRVVFTDLGLPGLGGVELARTLRRDRTRENLSIVAVANSGDARSIAAALSAGADAHVERPFTSAAIRRVLAPLLPSVPAEERGKAVA